MPHIRWTGKCALSEGGLPNFLSTATHVEVPTFRQALHPDEPLYELLSGSKRVCRWQLATPGMLCLNPVRQCSSRG